MVLWVRGPGPAGRGLAEELGCLLAPQALSTLADHHSDQCLPSAPRIGPGNLSTLQDKLSVQAPGPLAWDGDWVGASGDLPVPFPPPASVLSPEGEDPGVTGQVALSWDDSGAAVWGRKRGEPHPEGVLSWLVPNSPRPPTLPPPGGWVPLWDLWAPCLAAQSCPRLPLELRWGQLGGGAVSLAEGLSQLH